MRYCNKHMFTKLQHLRFLSVIESILTYYRCQADIGN